MIAAVGQLCATNRVADNLSKCVGLITKAAQHGAKMVFLPEASDFIADKEEVFGLTETLSSSAFVRGLQEAAKSSSMFVSAGVHEKVVDDALETLVRNTHIVINGSGTICGIYRKLHLFDVNISNGPVLMESRTTLKGTEVVSPIATPIGNVGLGVCYDLRFPEFSTLLRQRGAEIITYPSAFTVKTGQAHWEVLLRSRAIETQSYVIAAAQVGKHNAKRESYGRAMIVDPWGKVVAECVNETGDSDLAYATIDLEYLKTVRRDMPVMDHRRDDVYQLKEI
ncbi:putative NIT2-nitrilase [Cladochytrium replicatum]|nr:putative NIT2-nitrilase [Cladochytrium replicatum]